MLWIKEENKKDYSEKVIHLLLVSKSLASQKLWYWALNADSTECNGILKMFKPDWSSLVKTMMVFSACQIKVYFMVLALNSVGYLPVANGFRLLISPLQKWLSEIWPDFRMILRYIFAACSQTSHKLVFIWALITLHFLPTQAMRTFTACFLWNRALLVDEKDSDRFLLFICIG